MLKLTKTISDFEHTPPRSPVHETLYIDLTGAVYCKGFMYSPENGSFTYSSRHKTPHTGMVFSDHVQRQPHMFNTGVFGTGILVDSSLNFYTDSYGNMFTDAINKEYPEYTLYVVQHPEEKDNDVTLNLVANPDRYTFKVIDRSSEEGERVIRKYDEKAKGDLAILSLLEKEHLEKAYKETFSEEHPKTEIHKIITDFNRGAAICLFSSWVTKVLTPAAASKVALQRAQRDIPEVYTHTVTLRKPKTSKVSYEVTSKTPRSK